MDTSTFPYPAQFFLGEDVVAEYPAGTEYELRARNPDEPRDVTQVISVRHEGGPTEYDLTEYRYQLNP